MVFASLLAIRGTAIYLLHRPRSAGYATSA